MAAFTQDNGGKYTQTNFFFPTGIRTQELRQSGMKVKYVTIRPPSPPQFDVSLPENLLKIVAIRGEIFSLKFTKYRSAAGLRPDPLGS